jgi:hypothetical protein
MGYTTRVQVIARQKGQRQFYFICPAALAAALEIEKGEPVEWVVIDRETLQLRRGAMGKVEKEERQNGHRSSCRG